MTVAKNSNLAATNLTGLSPKEMSELLSNTIPAKMDPTQLQLAYGQRAIPKLISELGQTLVMRQKALISLAELLHNPENIAYALKQELIDKLSRLLGDTNITVRQKVTECLSLVSEHAVGRHALVDENIMVTLAKLFNDEDPMIRKNTHATFRFVSTQQNGVENILTWGTLPTLVQKLPTERIDIQCIILDTLYNLIRMGRQPCIPRDAIESDAMTVFTNLLAPETVTDVKVGTAKCIMMLSFNPDGKKLAVKGKTISALIPALKDAKSEVRAAAAGALMSITIDCEAKRIMVRENAIAILTDLLLDENESVLLNVVKTITNCAEDYRGRFQLLGCIKKLEAFKFSSNTQLAESSKKAIQVITWRP